MWAMPRPETASMKLSAPNPKSERLSSETPKYIETIPSRIL